MAYAWLLAAYPRDYRREHGAELLEPLIAEARRPTVRETANLVAHGFRTRLGRPTSRTVVAWAVLVTAMTGLFGAAFGSLAGWRTADPLPPPARMRTVLADALPGRSFATIHDPGPSPAETEFELLGTDLSWDDVDGLLFGTGAGYQATAAVAQARIPTGVDPAALTGHTSARLAASGWSVRASTPARIRANRDGLVLTLTVDPAGAGTAASILAEFERTTPAGVWIGATAGGLPAATVAFLIFAWASRRTGRPGHPARLAVAFPFGLAMLFCLAAVPAATALLASSLRGRPRAGGLQPWELLDRPTPSLLFVAGGAFAVLSLFLAAQPASRELRRAEETAGW
ncbi:hypothetical protein [Actinoplanes sp. NBRC 103695]|uniref:hypothetical protein n=1 Tax=Actinoplanes sp. NBRC 103695 TaxID=3032202 RepID=UPI0024A144E8|nr:hypothetical protein [Actinoplanes sp. NBRC 103695]GLY94012.1 hypothetical protein Acsp02_12680 [Actinoplanes sp. NBRC 103695]